MIYLSVGELMEMAVRSGSIDSRFAGQKRAVEGTRLHQKLQRRHTKTAKAAGFKYEDEVSISLRFDYLEYEFFLSGRIDGMVKYGDCIVIEEIKSVGGEIEGIEAPLLNKHLAQAKVYAYMYMENSGLCNARVYLTYCDLKGNEKSLGYEFGYEELKEYFYNIFDDYYKWIDLNEEFFKKRNNSIEGLVFPYGNFRKGQRELSVAVYKTLVSKKKLFAAAPTGTGKTLGVLFPAIKYLGKAGSRPKRIFYLTAKNTVKALAEGALKLMEEQGLFIKSVTLTGKEKICPNGEVSCSPVKCSRAKGHFDRVNDAIWEVLTRENVISGEIIKKYAEKHHVCPFEMSLDIANFAHVIICDYNYAFDPTAKLCRFFDEDRQEEYLALIDEAHNLPDRSRDMYTAELKKSEFLEAKRALKEKTGGLIKSINKVNGYMLREKAGIDGVQISENRDEAFMDVLSSFTAAADRWLIKNEGREGYEVILDLYFKVLDYVRIDEYFDSHFVMIRENIGRDIKKTLFCRDSSQILRELEANFTSIVFFSATLKPGKYFIDILGGDYENDNRMEILSPFDRKRLKVITDYSVSTVYKDREKSCLPIAERIFEMYSARQGNYLCFFPSYEYMERVYEQFCLLFLQVKAIKQEQSFTEENRAEFLAEFKENSGGVIGFCVMGGVFAEGIDLKGERLIGCCIVGVGLPKISVRQEVIRDYFEKDGKDGFAYGYGYTGMIKVSQAGGRVIRAAGDKGVILLLDRRFGSRFYKELLPAHWQGGERAFGKNDIKMILDKFWRD